MSSQFTNNSNFNVPVPTMSTATHAFDNSQRISAITAQQNLLAEQAQQEQINQAESQGINWGTISTEVNSKIRMPELETVQERRQKALREATERARYQLEGDSREDQVQEIMDRASGKSEEEIQANRDLRRNIRTMSDEERLDNYLRKKSGDPNALEDLELRSLIESGSREEIEYKLKDYPKVLELVNNERDQRLKEFSQTTSYDSTNEANSVLAWGNLKSAVASGLAETVGAVSGAWDMATKDGAERLESMNDPNSLKNQLLDWADMQKNNAGKTSDVIAQGDSAMADYAYDVAYTQARKDGLSQEQAESKADLASLGSTIQSALTNKLSLTNEMAEMIPDVVTGLGTGLVASTLKKGGMKAVENLVEKEIKKNALNKAKKDIVENIADKQQQKELIKQAEISIKQGKVKPEELDKAVLEKKVSLEKQLKSVVTGSVMAQQGVQTGLQNAPQGYESASKAIMQMDTSVLMQSDGAKKLKEQHPEMFDKQIQKLLADEAGSEAYRNSGIMSGIVGVLGGFAEGKLASRLFAGSKVPSVKEYVATTALDGVAEGSQEGITTSESNKAINKTLGDKYISETKGVMDSAAIGAMAGAGTTGAISAIPVGKLGASVATKKTLETVNEKQQEKLNQQSDNEINSIYGNPTVDTRTTVQKVKDKVTGTTEPEVKTTGVFGKKFSETNFGKTWNELSPEDENVKKLIDENKSSYTGTVLKLRQREQELVSEFQQAQANKDTATATKLEKEWNSIQTTLNSLKESLQKDVMSGNPEVSKKLEQINSLVQNQASEEEINKVWDEIDSIQANDKELTKLTESNLYKLLSDNPSSIEDSERITTEDILGNPNYSVPNYGKFNSETNKKLSNMEDLVKAKDSKTIRSLPTELAKIFTQFSVVNQKNNTEPRKALVDATKLLNRAELLLKNSGTKNPKLEQAIKGFREAIEIANSTKQNNNSVFKEIYFGSMKNGKYSFGLMDYLADSLRNGGELSLPMRSNLVKFNLSQLAKVQGLNKALEHFNSSTEPVDLENLSLRSKSKLTQSLSGSKVTLRSKSAVENYKKKVLKDLNAFRSITNALLNSTSTDTVIDPDIPTQIKDTSKISSKDQAKQRKAILDKIPNTQEEFDKVKDSLLKELTANGDGERLATTLLNSEFKKKLNSSTKIINNSPENPVVKRVFSGAAYGADSIWSKIANKYGVNPKNIIHYTVTDNKSSSVGTRTNVSSTLKQSIQNILNDSKVPNKLKEFIKKLPSSFPNPSDLALQQRNILQIINADAVFAVSPINSKGGLERSGTATAINAGKAKGIPVYVLDTNTNKWHTFQNGKWSPINDTPKLTKSPALVGTRGLEEYSKFDKKLKKWVKSEKLSNADDLIKSMEELFTQTVPTTEIDNNNNNNNNNNNSGEENTTTTTSTSNTNPEVQPNVDNGLGTFADSSMPFRTRVEVSNPYIGDIVAKEFSQFSQWGNGKIGNDLTEFDSEETDTIFEVNTSEGKQTYRLPMSAMVELHRKGFDPTVNLVEKITTEKELDTISKNFLDILKQDGTDLLGSMGLEESEASLAYAESFKENLQEVNEFFNKNIPVILNQRYKSKLSKFVLANGMLNFISIEEGKNGKPVIVIPPEVKVAFAKAVSFIKSDSSSLSFGKHSQFQDYFFEELGATDVAIFKATDVERFGKGFKTENFEAKREQVELSNYSELGMTRNNFIQLLGEQVLDNFPLNINKGSEYYSEDIHNGLVQSLGIEAYNIMLQQGLLEVHYVDIIKENSEQQGKLDTHTIPYVNFKTNISENLSDKEQLAYEAVSSGVDLDGMSVEQGQSFLEKNNKHLLNQAILVRYKSDELDSQIYNTENARNSGVFISSLSGRVGKQYRNRTETVKSSDTKNDITPTNNEKLVNAIGSMNTVTYALNQEYYGLLKTNPEALQLAFGYTQDIDNLPVTESTKKSLRSKNNDILRAIGLLKRFVSEAEAKGLSEEDIAFNFRHHFVTNMRTMLKADMNPQSNKIIREMLRLVQTEVNQDDGKIIGELKLEINLGTKKSKFRSENGSPRTIEQLIKVAKGKRQSQDKNFAVGFLLALAQGLDLGKIEKTKNQDIFTMVQDWFNDTENNFRKDAMEIVWKMQLGNETGTPYVLSKEEMDVMSKFGKEMGTAAPRALYALQSLANYMYRGTEKDPLRTKRNRMRFATNLLLEADGIGNGLYNITKQFTLDFTEEYLNTIKRTGVIPLDILSQKYFQSKKKLKGDKLVEELQGSAGMFTKDSPDTQGLRDIYEVIADKLSKEANEAVQRIINSDYAKGKISLSWKDFKFKLKDDNPNKQLIEDIKLLSQLSLTGHIKLSEDTKLEDIVFTPADVAISEDFLIEVKRNLSKAGVTPTVYGGQLEGIANQLTGDIKGQYIKMSDKLIQLASEINSMKHGSKEYKEAIAKLEAGINTLHNYNLVLGIPQSSLTKITDELSNKDINVFELVKSNLDSNIFLYGVNSKNVKFSLKSGLASSLQKAIQDTYVGAFSMLNYSMSHDDVGFHNFIVEFQDKVKAKIEERNKEKGYAKNDPRNHSPLSKQEIREVIKTITSAPIIATAYSNSAELFEDVWELGNSLVKRGKYSVDEQTTLNSSYASVQRGGYQRNITTQLFRNYQKYVAAGASNATSTTPSTESVTQTGLAQELLDRLTGITSLNVFDGIDGLLYFRDLLGQIANKITNQTHIETNLVKHFYNRFIKSGMVTLPETYAELSSEFKKKVNTMSLSKLLQQDFTNLNQKDIGYLLGVLTLTQMKLEASKLNPEYLSDSNKDVKQSILESIKLINAYKSRITEFRDNLLFNPKTTVNKLNLSELFNDNLAYTLDSTFSDKVRDNKGNYVDPNVGFAFGYNMNLLVQDFAYKVSQAEALRYIESKYLPSIINQFAGANRGYLFNEKELDAVGKRFYEFALTKFGSRINEIDFRTDSATLAEFLKTDKLIQSEYQTKLENNLKKMDIPSTNHHWITQNANENVDNYNNRLSKSEKQNSDKSLNEIYTIDEVISKYDYFADNTLSGRVFKTLTHNVKQLFGDNFRLSYDSEQIAKYLKDKGVSDKNISHAVNEMNTTDAGGFKWEFKNNKGELISFIFLNPREKMTGHFLQNLLNHELLHTNLHYLAGYMSNPSIRTDVDVKLGDNNPFKQSANRIKSIIDSMVQNSKHLSEVQELLQIYNSNPSDFHHYKYLKGKYNQVSGSLANYIFLSQMNGKSLPTGWNVHDYSTELEGTIHELLAYSLGNPDSLLELANRKEARDLSVWEKLKEFFGKARQELLKVLGLEDKDLKESNLNGLLESLVNVNTIDSDISKTITSLKDISWTQARTSRRNSRSSNESFSPLQSMYLNDHEKHLQDLTNTFTDNIGEVFKQVNGELAHGEETIIASKSLKDTELNNFVKDLRNAGLSMNQEEEKVFKLAYASNVANFETGSNSDLLRETTKVMQDILNNTDFGSLPTKVTNLLFKNNFNQNALLLAMFSTNKQLKDIIDTKVKSNSKLDKALKNLETKLNDWTIFKEVPTTGSNNVIDKLQYSAMLFSFRNKQSQQEKDRILRNEMAKAEALVQQNEWLDGLLAEFPNGLAKYLSISKDALTGRDLFQDGSGADSSIGQLIRLVVRNNEKLYGRNTLFSKGLLWIIGQDTSTQYSAKFKGESQQLTSVIRERLASVIPHSIRKQFENDLTKRDEEALDNVLITSELHRIADINSNGMKPELILKDSRYRQQAISDVWNDLNQELDTEFTGNKRKEIENFLRWQTQGLGELMVTRTAKSNNASVSHEILPNGKAISAFAGTKWSVEPDKINPIIREKVEQLVTLYSLEHQNQDDLNTIADLFTNNSTGMKALVDTLKSLDNERNVHGNTVLGEDGYRYNKRNPNQDVKLMHPNSNKKDLIRFGYSHKATLPSGTEVWVTNDNINNRFTTGIFGLSDSSVKGVTMDGMNTLGSFTGSHSEARKYHFDKAIKDPNYYSKLKEKSSIKQTISANGKEIISEVEELPRELEKQFIDSYENGIDSIGNAKGRTMEEIATEQNNIYYIDQLNKHYHKSFDKSKFTKIDGNAIPKGKSQADKEFANRLNNIYNSLPEPTKMYIEKEGGLYIETTEIDNLLGYHKASITDVWTDKSGLPKPVQETIKQVISIFSKFTGLSEPVIAKRSERLLTEVVHLGKDFILNRSGVVAFGNLASNVIHLWNTGIPLKQIPLLMKDGLQHIKQYNHSLNRLAELHHQNDITKEPKVKSKIEAEIKLLQESLDKSPVKPLVDEGILTSITLENERDEKEFDYIPQFQRKLGLDKFKETRFGKVWSNVMVQDGSTTHEFMEQALDLGDFVAKYALYTHLTKNRQFKHERAMNVIRDEFVNYGYNRGRVFDFLNQTGLTWFLSYKLGIQKIFFRNLRRNFLRTSAVYAGAKALDTNQVVPLQNLLLDGSLSYQLDPSNVYKSFGSHWLSLIL